MRLTSRSWTTQELRLHAKGHVTHLVQKQRALVGGFDEAHAVRVSAAERPLLAAEQLDLEQALRQGRAVDRHERLRRAAAGAVQRARGDLLAGSRLARDEDREIGGRDLGQEALQLRHRLRVGDDLVDRRRADPRCGAAQLDEKRQCHPAQDPELTHRVGRERVRGIALFEVERGDHAPSEQHGQAEQRAAVTLRLRRAGALRLGGIRDPDRALAEEDLRDDWIGEQGLGAQRRQAPCRARSRHAEGAGVGQQEGAARGRRRIDDEVEDEAQRIRRRLDVRQGIREPVQGERAFHNHRLLRLPHDRRWARELGESFGGTATVDHIAVAAGLHTSTTEQPMCHAAKPAAAGRTGAAARACGPAACSSLRKMCRVAHGRVSFCAHSVLRQAAFAARRSFSCRFFRPSRPPS